MISVFCLEWLRHGWFFISLFMDFDSPYCNVTSSLTLWAFSYIHFMLAWNVKLLLCSLDLVACIIIALSYILLLVWLFCSPLMECTGQIILASCVAWFIRRFVSQCFGYDPCGFVMVFISSVDVSFSWLVSTPVLRWVAMVVHIFLIVDGSGCCLWSLMIILALVAFVPRSYVFWLALLFEWPMFVLWDV
jgi:hypothetical protein